MGTLLGSFGLNCSSLDLATLVGRKISRFLTSLAPWTGAPCSRFCVHGLNTTFFQCIHHPCKPTYRKNKGGLPPDFLWSLVALANLMRLSLLKAAHAVLSGAAYRKSGSPISWQAGKAAEEMTADKERRVEFCATQAKTGLGWGTAGAYDWADWGCCWPTRPGAGGLGAAGFLGGSAFLPGARMACSVVPSMRGMNSTMPASPIS